MDRIDIHIEVTPVSFDELAKRNHSAEKSESIRERVIKARSVQNDRYLNHGIHCNAQMGSRLLKEVCEIDDAGSELLKTAMKKLNLSARAYDRILKVARTIADLDAADQIATHHLAEAIQYRSLDRENWAG